MLYCERFNIFVKFADSNYFLVIGRSDLKKKSIQRERENNHFISSDTKGIFSASLALVQNVRNYAWQSKCLNIDGLVARCETASCLTLAKEQLASGVVSNKSRSLYIVEHTRTYNKILIYNKIFSYMSMGPAPNSRLILIASVTSTIYHLAIIEDNISRTGSKEESIPSFRMLVRSHQRAFRTIRRA